MKTHWVLIFVFSILVGAVAEIFEGFSLTSLGIPEIIGRALGLIGITAVITAIPALIYWFVKRKAIPGLNILVWSIWCLVAVFSIIRKL